MKRGSNIGGALGWRRKLVTTTCLALALSNTFTAFPSPAEARTAYRSPRIALGERQDDVPLILLVSIKKQRIKAFDANGEVASSRVSTGQPGFDTPTGVFSVLEKQVYHESNIYEGAPMPHMQRLTWSGIALHAGVVPGYRASHGCIRMPASFAKSLFDITSIGSRVIVTPEDIAPLPYSNARLFKPLPAENPRSLSRYGKPQVAVNDVPDPVPGAPSMTPGMAEVPKLIGITPALAEAARAPDAFLPNEPRSRAEARLITKTRLTKLRDALDATERTKLEASAKAKAALLEVQKLEPQAAEANRTLATLRDAVVAGEKQLAAARQNFEAFLKGAPVAVSDRDKARGQKTVAAPPSPAAQERQLENAILDARLDVDDVRAELIRAQLEFAPIFGSLSSAQKAKADAIKIVQDAIVKLRAAQSDLIEFNREMVQNARNISIFVSLRNQRIYIRQGQDPLLEAPISVDDPNRRYGTHVFTAMRYDATGDNFDWRLVSAQLPAADRFEGPRDPKKKVKTTTLPYSAAAAVEQANDALDAFNIPADVMTVITRRAKPGLSLIVSDHELPAHENGRGTEFVVLTR